jgi:hypothetical protein
MERTHQPCAEGKDQGQASERDRRHGWVARPGLLSSTDRLNQSLLAVSHASSHGLCDGRIPFRGNDSFNQHRWAGGRWAGEPRRSKLQHIEELGWIDFAQGRLPSCASTLSNHRTQQVRFSLIVGINRSRGYASMSSDLSNRGSFISFASQNLSTRIHELVSGLCRTDSWPGAFHGGNNNRYYFAFADSSL